MELQPIPGPGPSLPATPGESVKSLTFGEENQVVPPPPGGHVLRARIQLCAIYGWVLLIADRLYLAEMLYEIYDARR